MADWARREALEELARIAVGLPFEDFDLDVRPRLARLTLEQRAIVEEGLLRLLELAEEQETRRASERLLDFLGWAFAWPSQVHGA